MPEAKTGVDDVRIKVSGNSIPIKAMDALIEVEVETTLYLPAMFILRFHLETPEVMDEWPFTLGAPVEIQFAARPQEIDAPPPSPQAVIKGEITALEPEFLDNMVAVLVVRGYDLSHRLNRGTNYETWQKITDSDLVKRLATKVGLNADVDDTRVIHDHVFQDNRSYLAYIHYLANRNGFEITVDDKKFAFKKPKAQRPLVELEWGKNLRIFRPRASLAGQVDHVTVNGWDPRQKQTVTSQALSSKSSPKIGLGEWGGAVAQSKIGAAAYIEANPAITNTDQAKILAQALLDDINAHFVEAEGIAFGDPALVAGTEVQIKAVGSSFNGKYVVTTATHLYLPDGVYETRFIVQGSRPRLMVELAGVPVGTSQSHQQWNGVLPAIVTDINDPEKLSRVKVKFPWLNDDHQSWWARIVAPGAGNQHGIQWLPEVNDEVLVALENGDFNRLYILGGLWNGRDKPPEPNAPKNGLVEIRTMKSRAGHIIRMIDEAGKEAIEIIDAKGETSMKMSVPDKKIALSSTGDFTLNTTGNITLESKGNITIKATGNISMEATGNADVKATGQLGLKGSTANLEGSASTTIKGGIVKIN